MAQTDYISQAKAYLHERLSAEISFQNNLEALIEEYAYELTDIAYAANVPPNLFTFEYNDTIKRNGNIYYSLIDDTYRAIDVSGEVYVEEFNNAQEMHERYDERVHEQVTIFDY